MEEGLTLVGATGRLSMKLTLEDRIRQRAYFLSLSGGGAGDETHFWLIAEREVLAGIGMESAAASPEAIQSVQAAKPTAVVQAIETACAGAIMHVSKHRQLFVSLFQTHPTPAQSSFTIFAAIHLSTSHVKRVRLPRLVLALAEADIGDRLTIAVADDECLLDLGDGPGRPHGRTEKFGRRK